uniref:CENP-V/GFA domain-containing protein n=1 Tax=Chromera velia CCMP2878 TaxID=1169474 RepID=A0A0G4FBW9_9ALVE|eukprot:Cvel_16099.t1-p1 / transcript=Cvel_16099.t1 / gene=Cvel_16099 / organism=Chromera_velia_CCMP2878 / gene_product=hypothetical protein / transcript_product=hypothetical protein / location=Cvel_scaffold1225:7479-8504(+) / protein_length=342 / sequence_SO=supercontig / SO=protein_coding / is_pseudo=false
MLASALHLLGHVLISTTFAFTMITNEEFSLSFRSRLNAVSVSSHVLEKATIKVRCQCGNNAFAVEVERSSPVVRCHCVRCRKFHTSAFASYLKVSRDAIPCDSTSAPVQKYLDSCNEIGPVERLSCGWCNSVLASVPAIETGGPLGGGALLALGCVEDASIPPGLAKEWAHKFEEWKKEESAKWWEAAPSGRPIRGCRAERTLRGGCACGACTFEAWSGSEFQTQHCYCNLCRRLSGSVAQTWIPVYKDGFRWTKEDKLRVVRTTKHGQRHMCTGCGGVMTIVYDDQPYTVWPCAGAIEDDSMPKAEDMSRSLCRAIHICCSMMQPWYELPEDGLPRLKYAG